MFADTDFSSVIFKVNHVFKEEEDNPSEYVVINEEKLGGVVIDGIWNLKLRRST